MDETYFRWIWVSNKCIKNNLNLKKIYFRSCWFGNENKKDPKPESKIFQTIIPLSNIEMIGFENCSEFDETLNDRMQLMSDKREIKTALPKLKALCIQDCDKISPFFPFCMLILNTIGCQLTSLHIENDMERLDDWQFIKWIKNYPCTNNNGNNVDTQQESWYPKNVQHLCLRNHYGDENYGNANTTHFWEKINSGSFPSLRYFVCQIPIDVTFVKSIDSRADSDSAIVNFNNFASLIDNGLESLSIWFHELLYKDIIGNNKQYKALWVSQERKHCIGIDKLMSMLIDAFGNLRNLKIGRGKSENFVLKIGMAIDSDDNQLGIDESKQFDEKLDNGRFDKHIEASINGICDKLSVMFFTLCHYYKRVMFTFELYFIIRLDTTGDDGGDDGDDDDSDDGKLHSNKIAQKVLSNFKQAFKRKAVFDSDDTHIVGKDAQYRKKWRNKEDYCSITITFTSQNKGKNNVSSDHCYADPKYEYPCEYCQHMSWS